MGLFRYTRKKKGLCRNLSGPGRGLIDSLIWMGQPYRLVHPVSFVLAWFLLLYQNGFHAG
jgi:hypothetical protein